MRRTTQKGYIRKHRGWWEVRYRQRVSVGGKVKTVQRAKRLCLVDEHHKTKASVRELAQKALAPVNQGDQRPETVTTLGDFIERVYLPHVKETKRPSTKKGYQDLYEYHIKDRYKSVWLRDVRTCDTQRWLQTAAEEDKNRAGDPICRTTLKHLKHFLGGVFRYAQTLDYFDSARPNPVHPATIPESAPSGKEGHAYSPEECTRMLELLVDPTAATAVAVAAWTGLRRGEIRGLTWESYTPAPDEDGLGSLSVTRSVWERHVTAPKTPKSAAPVPVIPQLAEKLTGYRRTCGNPFAGPILANRFGRPLDLETLYRRKMKDVLEKGGVQWRGWHAFRRGLASYLNRLSVDDSVIQRILRHSTVSVTQACYIKTAHKDQVEAMRLLSSVLRPNCAPGAQQDQKRMSK